MRRVYTGRYGKMGGSMGVLIPADLRRELQLEDGDLMLFTRYGPVLMLRRATRDMIFDKDSIPSAALPPSGTPGAARG